jgi:hypothetical protein
MLNRIIELSLNNRLIVLLLAGGLGVWGWWAVGATPIDAIRDLSDKQVIVFTEWAGHSAREVEISRAVIVMFVFTVSSQLAKSMRATPGLEAVIRGAAVVVAGDDRDSLANHSGGRCRVWFDHVVGDVLGPQALDQGAGDGIVLRDEHVVPRVLRYSRGARSRTRASSHGA